MNIKTLKQQKQSLLEEAFVTERLNIFTSDVFFVKITQIFRLFQNRYRDQFLLNSTTIFF